MYFRKYLIDINHIKI